MTAAQAIVKGLQLDPSSWEIGRSDGRRCARWSPPAGFDLLSYASGYLEGQQTRQASGMSACCDGERAQPELRPELRP